VTAMLARAGLIGTRTGAGGGAWLLRQPDKISLETVLRAVHGCAHFGAPPGIGEAFPRLYARHGHDLVLTARRAERLERLAWELRELHDVDVQIVPADLAEPGAVDRIIAAIEARGRDVDVLINNAGYGLPGAYAATTWSDQQAFLQVLLTAVCEMTHKLLPGMLSRSYGRVINVASVAGLIPGMPGATLYGPTKA